MNPAIFVSKFRFDTSLRTEIGVACGVDGKLCADAAETICGIDENGRDFVVLLRRATDDGLPKKLLLRLLRQQHLVPQADACAKARQMLVASKLVAIFAVGGVCALLVAVPCS